MRIITTTTQLSFSLKTKPSAYERKSRAWRTSCDIATREARRVHRATGGLEQLVHNWGNPKAVQAWARHHIRNRKIDLAYGRLSGF